jgi:putative FmdB family regulatory protein
MPTYDYRCAACGHTFEHFQSISSPLLRKCPKCAKTKLERLIGPGGGLVFKGSGFYITDYRSKSYDEAAKKDAAPASGADKAPSSGSDKSAGSDKGGEKSAPKTEPSKPAAKPASSPAPRAKKR